jgi:hypothetical protein
MVDRTHNPGVRSYFAIEANEESDGILYAFVPNEAD